MKSCVPFVLAAFVSLPTAVSGTVFDHDDDGDVDLVDYEVFFDCFTGPATPADPSCVIFDENEDLRVDLHDFGGFQGAFTGPGPFSITFTELAGNSLSAYPHFEYVKAFNENATVEVAIDPLRFPEIVGQTGDIYIVEAKTASGWDVDPGLVDETTDGPQTETFGGSTIQENTFLVTGPYELSSLVYQDHTGDFTGLGHGYDVALDMNQNGVLDGGDYLDGYSREAGLYVVHDTAQPGPLDVTYFGPYSVAGVPGVPAAYANEVLYYPTNIASMEPLPLIVIGHGSGHQYTWYDHIGYHMASYGCIVISHQNNFGGYATAAHTRAVIELQDSIADGALDGKVDSNRIIWIGHSMGGHGVVLAYDLVYDGTYVPEYYTVDDIVLLSPMLPIVEADDHPHHVNFHLWTASGDSDVSGHASADYVQTFHMHDRATGYRMSTVVQGTGHAWFHDGPEEPSWFEGPCSIGQENTHLIQLGLFLPLIKHYTEGNIPATDFFWRQYERFHPISVDTADPCIVVTNEYRNGSESGNFYIDDYQTEESLYTSSSGGTVSFTVENVTEGRLDDNNSSFTWTPDDPFNGATQAASYDTSRGVVFDWNGVDAYYEWEVIPTQQNFSDDLYLSFRGAQGTQHPYTLAELGDLTFSVTLRDGSGTTSSINIGAYGGGLEQPYQRQGGWHNEMEVIRIRLTDFLTNGSGLDLTDVAAVRFDVGPSWGSNEGRIVVDELMLTNNYWPYFTPLSLSMPVPPPEFLPPGVPTVIDVEIDPGDDTIVPGSALLHYRYDGGAWLDDPLEQIGSTLWQGTLPPPTCDDTPEFFFSVEGAITGPVYVPHGAPAVTFVAFVGEYVSVLDDDFEEDLGWTVEDDPSLMSGSWERGVPVDDGVEGDPLTDYDGSGSCYLTGNYLGNSDVDGGPTMLISPMIDLTGTTNPVLRYARWWANDDQDGDPFDVEVSDDGGSTWVLVEHVVNIPPGWVQSATYLADFVSLTAQVKVRFSCADVPNNSKDEGGVDAVEVFELVCEE